MCPEPNCILVGLCAAVAGKPGTKTSHRTKWVEGAHTNKETRHMCFVPENSPHPGNLTTDVYMQSSVFCC